MIARSGSRIRNRAAGEIVRDGTIFHPPAAENCRLIFVKTAAKWNSNEFEYRSVAIFECYRFKNWKPNRGKTSGEKLVRFCVCESCIFFILYDHVNFRLAGRFWFIKIEYYVLKCFEVNYKEIVVWEYIILWTYLKIIYKYHYYLQRRSHVI